ncbi:hypothetical protein [Sanguibacter sp. 25GB23B1]|uniref:hypothetical protein n=1 Tax=unclassified Sanguibacter TaxID=2645534 RepID=UPI0032AFF784
MSVTAGYVCVSWVTAVIYLGAVALVLAAVLGVLVWDARRTPTPSQAASRANRHATLASVVGVVVMASILTWMIGGSVLGVVPWRDGRVLALLPALAGVSLLVAQAIGQLTWPQPSGVVREAELTRRAVADVAPAWPRRLVFAWAGTGVLLLVIFGLVADGPRTMIRRAGQYTQAIGPYPGWYYGVLIGSVMVITVVATELVLRLIALRPAVVGVSAEWDLHLRRRSAKHVTRGVQLVLALTTAGVLYAAGRVHQSLGPWWIEGDAGGHVAFGSPAQQYLGTGLVMLAVVVLVMGLVFTVVPVRRRQRNRTAPFAVAVAS